MVLVSLDSIIRRVLVSKGLPLHYYVELMVHASTAVRELTFDSLQVFNTTTLTLNSYFAADLPCDFVDDILVGIPVGQFLQTQTKRDNISPLRNQSATDGSYIPYGTPTSANVFDFFGFWPGWFWYSNMDDLGENVGRYFGIDSGATSNGYQIFRERGQIQFTETFASTDAVLIYLSDGQTLDNCSQITPLAFACIEAFINWKRSKNADIEKSAEAYSWANQRRLFRARMNQLTLADLRQTLYSNYRASPKE